MKIKDIRQFRTLYKEQIRELPLPSRDEHYIGVRTTLENGDSKFGFFEIYHGDKEGFNQSDGIKGFLEGFLNMAKDGQAVYEFIQNAVDAGSSQFCLFWGVDETNGNSYLLVVNNGKMFDFDGIRSILNVGVSTKSSDTQTIGKFGIGFKLAHRLVGKDNGLEELIHKNYGPILFSWQNNEILNLQELSTNTEVLPVKQDYDLFTDDGKRKAKIKSTEPWLFKILITNFPCQPENESSPELIRDYFFKETSNAFSKPELQTLGRWINKYADKFNNADFNEGSLFFLKLGQGKQSHLEENNLEEGVRFSITILNRIAQQNHNHKGLQKVLLHDKTLKPVDIDFIEYKIDKSKDLAEYRKIRFDKTDNLNDVEQNIEDADSNIEILIGYTEYSKAREVFTNAPNFYLYFPLNEEKHKLRFIIHSNAFDKSSSRTFLQPGNNNTYGINERLMESLVSRFIANLKEWAFSNHAVEKERFIQLYANILLSDESDNPERMWVNKPLVKPLLSSITQMIPVTDSTAISGFSIVTNAANVKIFQTGIPINPIDIGLNIRRFYWDSDVDIISAAINKVGIKPFNIIDALKIKGAAIKINELITGNDALRSLILKEINEYIITETNPSNDLRDNFYALELFQFDDNSVKSINQLAVIQDSAMYLLLFEAIDAISRYLNRAGFSLSIKSLTLFPNIQSFIQARQPLDYFKYEFLNVYLSKGFENVLFTTTEKHEIFKVLESAKKDRTEIERNQRMQGLKLFCNNLGKIMSLGTLLKTSLKPWLKSYVIKPEEYDANIERYLLKEDSEIYKNLLIPYWNEIIEEQKDILIANPATFYHDVVSFHEVSRSNETLTDSKIIYTNKGFVNYDSTIFFQPLWQELSDINYSKLSTILKTLFQKIIPDKLVLEYLQKAPFKISISKNEDLALCNSQFLSNEDIIVLCNAFNYSKFDFLDHFIFQSINNNIQISVKNDTEFQYWSDANSNISQYIKSYHKELIKAPNIDALKNYVHLKEQELLTYLIVNYDYSQHEQTQELITLLAGKGDSIAEKLFSKIPNFTINTGKNSDIELLSFFVGLLIAIKDKDTNASIFREKLTFVSEDGLQFKINDNLSLGSDSIYLGETKQYHIKLSDIFKEDSSKKSTVIENLIEKLISIKGFNKADVNLLFNIKDSIDIENVFTKLTANHQQIGYLENASQMAFVILYAISKDNSDLINDFKLRHNNTIASLNQFWACDKTIFPFFDDETHLDNTYSGLGKIFRLDERRTFFKFGEFGVFIKPELKDDIIISPLFRALINDDERINLLNFLLSFKSFPENLKINPNWESIFGLNPNLFVAKGPKLAIEELPKYLIDFSNNEPDEKFKFKKIKLLTSIGFHFGKSSICRLRQTLIPHSFSVEFSIEEISNINHILLKNTLLLLINQQQNSFQKGSNKYNLIKVILKRLSELGKSDFPIPLIRKNTNTFHLTETIDAYYFDLQSQLELEQRSITISDFIKVFPYPIFDATIWQDSGLFKSILKPLKLEKKTDTVNLEKESIIWAKPFYSSWAINNNDIIIKQISQIPYLITIDNIEIQKTETADIIKESNIIYISTEFEDSTVFRKLKEKNFLTDIQYNELNSHFANYTSKIQALWETNKMDGDEITQLKSEIERRFEFNQKVKDILSNLRQNEYSYKWFLCLIELEKLQSNQSDNSIPQKDISFFKLELDPSSDRILILKEPNQTITPTIEYCTDFDATIIYNNNYRHNIKIQGVCKKAQSVWAILPQNTTIPIENISNIKFVELRFSRQIQLIDRLLNAFKMLGTDRNWSDTYCLKTNLPENIDFIFGPPGTGKTTRIAQKVNSILDNNACKKKILILNPTNKAADVITEKILNTSGNFPFWLVRYGAAFSNEIFSNDLYYDSNTFKLNSFDTLCLVTTIHRFPYEEVNDITDGVESKIKLCEIPWDYIIFDEASMLSLSYIIFSIHKTTNNLSHYIIGGDPFQIPPVLDIADEDLPEDFDKEDNIYKLIGLSTFVESEQQLIPKYGHRIENLTTQYRSIELIGKIFSHFKYNGILSHFRNNNSIKVIPSTLEKIGIKPISLIRFPVNGSESIYKPGRLRKSPYHIYSALLILEMLKYVEHNLTEKSEKLSIGIVCPYRSQASFINKMVESSSCSSVINITTDTVHGFQGDECDIIFFLVSPTYPNITTGQFLNKDYLVNVAISRARDYLVIFYPDDETAGIHNLYNIHNPRSTSLESIITSQLEINLKEITMHSHDIEKTLFNENKHIENNVFTNKHELINVFNFAHYKYILKESSTAIDIQFKS